MYDKFTKNAKGKLPSFYILEPRTQSASRFHLRWIKGRRQTKYGNTKKIPVTLLPGSLLKIKIHRELLQPDEFDPAVLRASLRSRVISDGFGESKTFCRDPG
jgi:hypothetical protein